MPKDFIPDSALWGWLMSMRELALPLVHGLLGFAARVMIAPMKRMTRGLFLGFVAGFFVYEGAVGYDPHLRSAIVGIAVFLGDDLLTAVSNLVKAFRDDPVGTLNKITSSVRSIFSK